MSSKKSAALSLASEIRALNMAWIMLASRMAKESPTECKIVLGLKPDEIAYLAESSAMDIAVNSVESIVIFKPRISVKSALSRELSSKDYSSMINKR